MSAAAFPGPRPGLIPTDAVMHQAAHHLSQKSPELSARQTLTRPQAVGALAALAVLLLGAVLAPRFTLNLLCCASGLAFLLSTWFKAHLALRGARFGSLNRVAPGRIGALSDDELPLYTVLVPVFMEAAVMPSLIANLSALDYPHDKLQIILLTEQDDRDTALALANLPLPSHIEVLVLPPGGPKTKPRACNVGLAHARGEFLVIFDAEDRPEPDQLKKAVLTFRDLGPRVGILQAALNYFNAHENPLTRMFTVEYSAWFDCMLPGLERDGLPMPLGGTSNHFRVGMLRALGGWDPYNVTEDADLGIRASIHGHRVAVLDSTTWEEANTSVRNFIRQRSRWVKGYLQTLLVHSRRPGRLLRALGPARSAALALLIGGTPLAFLLALPLALLSGVVLLLPSPVRESLFWGPTLWLSLSGMVLGQGLIIHHSAVALFRRKNYRLVPWALLNPLYWVLHTIASYKAVWQLITKPHYWEKTTHGLSKLTSATPTAHLQAASGGSGRMQL